MAFNPAFNKNAFAPAPPPAPTAEQQQALQTQNMTPQQLQDLYSRASAGPVETERMSYDDVIMKTAITLGVVLVGAVIGWFNPYLAIPAAIIGFVLALVNIFKKVPSAPLVIAYAFAEGIFVGGISYLVEVGFNQPGIALQALLGTALVFGVTLVLFRTGKVRESKRATKVFIIAGIAYAAFSLVNLVLMLTGASTDPWGLRSVEVPILGIPLGLLIGPLVILMAAYSLRHGLHGHQARCGSRYRADSRGARYRGCVLAAVAAAAAASISSGCVPASSGSRHSRGALSGRSVALQLKHQQRRRDGPSGLPRLLELNSRVEQHPSHSRRSPNRLPRGDITGRKLLGVGRGHQPGRSHLRLPVTATPELPEFVQCCGCSWHRADSSTRRER